MSYTSKARPFVHARSKFANELALEKEGQEKSSNVMEIERVGAHD
jgi:hypothetical protein